MKSPRPESSSSPPAAPSAAPVAAADEQTFARQDLDGRFTIEERDPSWAPKMETRLAALLAENQISQFANPKIECRASLCKLDLATASVMALSGLHAVQRSLARPLAAFVQEQPDGAPHTIIYLDDASDPGEHAL